MNSSQDGFSYGSTETVAPDERLSYWDHYNAAALVGLHTRTWGPLALAASQTNATLATMRVAEIVGNQHAVERSAQLVRNFPKDAVFACHLVHGHAEFEQDGVRHVVGPLETMIYDTRRPFSLCFPGDMHELLIDIPVDEISERWGIDASALPIKAAPSGGISAAIGAELRRALKGYLHEPNAEMGSWLSARTDVLLRAMAQAAVAGVSPDSSLFHVLSAKTFIAQHLGDADLRPLAVARYVGVSVRHLNRLFAQEGTALSEYIWDQRLQMARRDLASVPMRNVSIGDIAFRWGFSSQAHFSRAISARYGAAPSMLRRINIE
jgi:AraC-like DNA-binding protein